jgi:hypothetical protein
LQAGEAESAFSAEKKERIFTQIFGQDAVL